MLALLLKAIFIVIEFGIIYFITKEGFKVIKDLMRKKKYYSAVKLSLCVTVLMAIYFYGIMLLLAS